MIWEVQVCGSDNFVSSALNNDAILGTREKLTEWIRRQAKLVLWRGQRGRVAAWMRAWGLENSAWSYEMVAIPSGVFAKCFDFPVLYVHPLQQNKECGSKNASISNTDLSLKTIDSVDASLFAQILNILVHYYNTCDVVLNAGHSYSRLGWMILPTCFIITY